MTVKRQDLQEEYSTTAGWLKDFADELNKKSYNIENLTNIRQMMDPKKSYSSIDEKMADIKRRIGFEIIKEMHKDSEPNTKISSEGSYKVKTASENREEHIRAMKNILSYTKDLIKHENAVLTPIMVLAKLRDEPSLYFEETPVDLDKFTAFVEKELNRYADHEESTEYVPIDDSASDSTDPNPNAAYFDHAFPERG